MQSPTAFLCAICVLIVLTGCGGGSNNSATEGATADFTLAIAPQTVTLTPGGAPQAISITASAVNGFAGNISVSVGSLPPASRPPR